MKTIIFLFAVFVAIHEIAASGCAREDEVDCMIPPCLFTTCAEGTECVNNFCWECSSECVPKAAVKDEEENEEPECPKDKPRAECKINPCVVARCPADKKCVPSNCGGCSAKCVSKKAFKKQVLADFLRNL